MTANPGHQTGEAGMAQSLSTKQHVTEDASEQNCHHRHTMRPASPQGLGKGTNQPKQPSLGMRETVLRCQQRAQIVADCSSVPRPGWFKTQTKGKKEQSIRDQAQLNGRGPPDLEKSQAPKTRKRREGQALPGRPQLPVSAVAGVTTIPVL